MTKEKEKKKKLVGTVATVPIEQNKRAFVLFI